MNEKFFLNRRLMDLLSQATLIPLTLLCIIALQIDYLDRKTTLLYHSLNPPGVEGILFNKLADIPPLLQIVPLTLGMSVMALFLVIMYYLKRDAISREKNDGFQSLL